MANEFRDIGRDIRNAVLDAVNSGDYSQLNSRITSSVSAAIDEVNDRLKSREVGSGDPFPRWEQTAQRSSQAVAKKQEQAIFARRIPGFAGAIVATVFGACFTAGFGIATLAILVNFLVGNFGRILFYALGGSFGVLTVAGLITLCAGTKRLGFAARFRRYAAHLKGKTHFAIARLAELTGRSKRRVLKDLRQMIGRGMFLQGHIDDEQETLLLTDEVYSHYKNLQARTDELEKQASETEQERLLRETLAQGEAYLDAIRRANDAIPGEVVSAKLYRMESVVRRIFEQVRRDPSQIPELRRFLEYYMPMTQKLVETYQRLDDQPVAGENILKAREEIEKTLDTVNLAFENLYDSLFAHTAVDITSDIAVLKNMLQQEGLTGKDFN